MEIFAGLIIGLIIWFPIIHILVSSRSTGGAKLGWLICGIAFSWVGWAVFLIFTQQERQRSGL